MTEDDAEDRAGGTWYGRLRRVLKGEPATREDLLELLREAHSLAVLDADELEMLEGVLAVAETQVRDVMVPRSQMIVRFFVETPDQAFDLARWLRPATFIPESKRLNTLLKEFRGSRNHIAIVVDEYGGIAGLLTIEDVMEEIVGEIDDEHDSAEAGPIQQQEPGRYHVRALTRIEEFNEFFGTDIDDENFDTVGGLVMFELGHLPRKGETVSFGEFRFRVLQADRRRIHSLELTRGGTAPADGDIALA
jgi:magnesium and cobalt transporter